MNSFYLSKPWLFSISICLPSILLSADYKVYSTHAPNTYSAPATQDNANRELQISGSGDPLALVEGSALIRGATLDKHSTSGTFIPTKQRHNSIGAPVATKLDTISATSLTSQLVNLSTLDSAVAFIRSQAQLGNGLPKTFSIPNGIDVGNNQVLKDGVGLYDTSLALLGLLDAGQRKDAKAILDIYSKELFGTFTLRAYPNDNNVNSYQPLNASNYLLFDQAPDYAKYDGWNEYKTHTGPNAWMILAGAKFISDSRNAQEADDAGVLAMIKAIGGGLLLLQDTDGGIRYGPLSSSNNNGLDFNIKNTENNISAYAAFQALYKITKDQRYLDAANKIKSFLKTMMSDGGLLYAQTNYTAGQGWQILPKQFADSAGTWAISALGADTIDQIWGAGAAARMWMTTRSHFGRTTNATACGPAWGPVCRNSDTISGLDFTDIYRGTPENTILSPEWTAGGIMAIKQILNQCQTQGAVYSAYCSAGSVNRMNNDIASMQQFLSQYGGSYGVGPGMTSGRNGATGFDTIAAPSSITAMASVYAALKTDPLAWARSL